MFVWEYYNNLDKLYFLQEILFRICTFNQPFHLNVLVKPIRFENLWYTIHMNDRLLLNQENNISWWPKTFRSCFSSQINGRLSTCSIQPDRASKALAKRARVDFTLSSCLSTSSCETTVFEINGWSGLMYTEGSVISDNFPWK